MKQKDKTGEFYDKALELVLECLRNKNISSDKGDVSCELKRGEVEKNGRKVPAIIVSYHIWPRKDRDEVMATVSFEILTIGDEECLSEDILNCIPSERISR